MANLFEKKNFFIIKILKRKYLPFSIEIKLPQLLLLLSALALFCSLGVWQWHRYQFKLRIVNQFQESSAQLPVPLILPLLHPSGEFTKVTVRGNFLDSRSVVWINRFYSGQIGAELLTPFQIAGTQQWILVNRGWLDLNPKALSSNTFIDARMRSPEETLSGILKIPEQNIFLMGANLTQRRNYPPQIQQVQISQIAQYYNHPLLPFILRLSPVENSGLMREWAIVNSSPEKHLGYSLQWFSFALILFVISVFRKTCIACVRDTH